MTWPHDGQTSESVTMASQVIQVCEKGSVMPIFIDDKGPGDQTRASVSLIGGRMKFILWCLVQASNSSARLSLGWATPKGTYQWWPLSTEWRRLVL